MFQNQVSNQCHVCGQGELLVVQNLQTREYSIICDDCECEWNDPESCLLDKRLPTSIKKVRDATQEEIRKLGWNQFLKNN